MSPQHQGTGRADAGGGSLWAAAFQRETGKNTSTENLERPKSKQELEYDLRQGNKNNFSGTPWQGRKLGTPSTDLAICSVIPAFIRKTVASKSHLGPSAISPSNY